MHDIKFIREQADAFDEAMSKRGLAAQSPKIIELDANKRALQTEIQSLQQRRKEIAKEIGMAKSKGEEPVELHKEGKEINQQIDKLESSLNEEDALTDLLSRLPNIPDEDIPVGPYMIVELLEL